MPSLALRPVRACGVWLHSRVSMIAPPYPLPEGWSLQQARREPAWRIAAWAVAYTFLVSRMIWHLLDGSLGWAVAQLLISGVIGLIAVGEFWLAGGERGRPVLVNAVALTRAEVRPHDSWVHLFRDGRVPVIVQIGLFVVSGFALTGAVSSSVLAIEQRSQGVLLLTIPTALVAAIGVIAAFATVLLDRAVRSFGRRPTGLALGRTGLTRLTLDDPIDIAWERIRSVRPQSVIHNAASGDFIASIELRTDTEPVLVPLGGMDAHAMLVYTAIRFWVEHPERRDELSTTFAQRRMLEWHAALHGDALPSPAPSP